MFGVIWLWLELTVTQKGVAMDTEPYPVVAGLYTEGGHVLDSVSRIPNGYEYGRRSRGRFRIPNNGYEYGRRTHDR